MVRLLADENFNGRIVKGLLRRCPTCDLVRAQDVGLRTETDPVVLEWAATQNRLLLTHDTKTIPPFAMDRVTAGQPMPGALIVDDLAGIGEVIDDLQLVIECTSEEEWIDRVWYCRSSAPSHAAGWPPSLATDEFGFKTVEKPVHVNDLHATLLRLLGFDHTRLTYRYAGRDFRLTDVHGEVVKELIA